MSDELFSDSETGLTVSQHVGSITPDLLRERYYQITTLLAWIRLDSREYKALIKWAKTQ